MHEHIADDPDFVAMFLDEARLAARIHHPNVVSTIDVQKTESAMFLVMEYIEGASLRHVLRSVRRNHEMVPIGIGCRIVIDTLNGLHAAHELEGHDGGLLKLVHRDVSPHNVLVGTDGISRITDFGVARAEARLGSTRGGTLKGKIAYMPPEQGRGEEIDRRADVYAAGVVLWEVLTGRRLFKADHDGALVAMILRGTDTSPDTVNPAIPKEIADVCMQALEIDPDERFASAADFAEAIEVAALESGTRLATARWVSSFTEEFKIAIETRRPPPILHGDATGSSIDSHPIEVETRKPPPLDEDVVTGTSQLTGIGTVKEALPPPPANGHRMLLAGLAIGAVVATVGVVLVTGNSDAPPAAVAPAQQPALEPAPQPVAAPEPAHVETAPAQDAPKAEEDPPQPLAAPTASATPKPAVKPRAPKGSRLPKKGKDNPLGFEPNDL